MADPVKILVLSDLHLAHSSFDVVQDGQRIDQNADVVVVAGDIGECVKGVATVPSAHGLVSRLTVSACAGSLTRTGGSYVRTKLTMPGRTEVSESSHQSDRQLSLT